MSPSKARHICRQVCWFKAARTLDSALEELRSRLTTLDETEGGVYLCPLAHPNRQHWHLTGQTRTGHSPAEIDRAIETLGADAYRALESLSVRPDGSDKGDD